jgi:hypothetical protein
MIEKLVKWQIKYSKILFVLIITLMISLSYYASNLKIETDFSKLVGDYSEFNVNQRVLESSFQSNDAMIILLSLDRNTKLTHPITSLDNPQVTQYISNLQEHLPDSQYVVGVSEPEFSKNKDKAKITVFLSTPNSIGGFKDVKKELEEYHSLIGIPPGITSQITGMPTLLDRVSTLLISDNLNTILITLIFVFLILYWYLRDVTFTLLALTTPLFSLIALAALMTYLQINVSVTLAAVGVLILGLGADYSIHITTHYRKLRRTLKSHTKALLQTIDELKIPITASFLTTLAGFIALIYGISSSSQEQGKVLSLGITIIFLLSFISFPVFLTVFRNHISVKPNKTFRTIVSYLSKLASYQTHHAKLVLTIIGGLTIVMMYGASMVGFSTSNSNWIPDGDPVSDILRDMQIIFGNVQTITLVLKAEQGDLRNVQTARDIALLKAQLEGIPYVDTVLSPYEGLSYDSSELYNAITLTPLRNQFNKDYTITTLQITTENVRKDSKGHSIVLQDIKEILEKQPIHNVHVGLYGDQVRFDELGKTIEKDAGVTTIISLILVFLVAAILYASISVGLISLFPIIIAVIWAVGFMGFFNVPFTTLSTSIIALVIGVGIDFSIHLVDSVRRYIKTMDLESALKETLESSGAAILLSSFTTFIGFMALLFAKLLGTQRLGLALAFSIVAVFLVTITMVPAVLSIIYNKHKNTQ